MTILSVNPMGHWSVTGRSLVIVSGSTILAGSVHRDRYRDKVALPRRPNRLSLGDMTLRQLCVSSPYIYFSFFVYILALVHPYSRIDRQMAVLNVLIDVAYNDNGSQHQIPVNPGYTKRKGQTIGSPSVFHCDTLLSHGTWTLYNN